MILKQIYGRGMSLSKKRFFLKRNIGWIIGSIGLGIILTFLVPIWGWIMAVGCGLIYIGWYLIGHYYD